MMSTAPVTIELSEPALDHAAEMARESGISVAAWIRLTVEQTLRDTRLATEFERRRSLGKDGKTLLTILNKAPSTAATIGDELPEGPPLP